MHVSVHNMLDIQLAIASQLASIYFYVVYMQLFMRIGIPRVITTDQGKEFNNTLNKKLMENFTLSTNSQLHITHRYDKYNIKL